MIFETTKYAKYSKNSKKTACGVAAPQFWVLRSELALRARLHVFNARTLSLVPSSEASATINCQLQAKRTWNYQLRHRRFGTSPFLVRLRLRQSEKHTSTEKAWQHLTA